MPYRRCGRSGLLLPAVSLGFWHNFGDDKPLDAARHHAHGLRPGHHGIHLANNDGPPFGTAEINAGRILKEDFAGLRDELVISTKAGWDGCGPDRTATWGSRKYLLASARPEPSIVRPRLRRHLLPPSAGPGDSAWRSPWGALATAVQQGKALYAGISSYSPGRTLEAARILREMGVPLLIHQPSYSMLNRWIEDGLLDALQEAGAGAITFSPLAQGLRTDRYLDGVPTGVACRRGQVAVPEHAVR